MVASAKDISPAVCSPSDSFENYFGNPTAKLLDIQQRAVERSLAADLTIDDLHALD